MESMNFGLFDKKMKEAGYVKNRKGVWVHFANPRQPPYFVINYLPLSNDETDEVAWIAHVQDDGRVADTVISLAGITTFSNSKEVSRWPSQQ